MEARRVEFDEAAAADLDGIYDMIADAAGPHMALSYTLRIHRACMRIDLASERGTRRDDIRPELRILGFERRVTIAFVVLPERVTILRIFYGGADWEQAF